MGVIRVFALITPFNFFLIDVYCFKSIESGGVLGMEQYLTIAEFAKKVGLSPQALYLRLDKDLKEYVKVIKGKKSLEIGALSLFDVEIEKEIKPEDEIISKLSSELWQEREKNKSLESELIYFKGLLKDCDNTSNIFKDQLIVKDKQIEALNDLVKSVTGLVDQSQRLNAAEKVEKMQGLVESPENTTKKWYQFWK